MENKQGKFKVIKGIFEGTVFNGHRIIINNEARIWNDDSQGQSFYESDCEEVVLIKIEKQSCDGCKKPKSHCETCINF